jgi:hypothetical protein
MNWLESLSPRRREGVFAAMREIGLRADEAGHRSRALQPRYGEIAVGSAHMDPFFEQNAAEAFLRALRQGSTPIQAGELAKVESRYAIRKWNDSREYQVHVWVGREDGNIDSMVRLVENAEDREPPPPPRHEDVLEDYPRQAPAGKIVAVSKERYRATAAQKRAYGGSTVTEFYVQFKGDPESVRVVKGFGRTPGDRKTFAMRAFLESFR